MEGYDAGENGVDKSVTVTRYHQGIVKATGIKPKRRTVNIFPRSIFPTAAIPLVFR